MYITEVDNDEININVIIDGKSHDGYYMLYSPLQKKRFCKVLKQLKNTWGLVETFLINMKSLQPELYGDFMTNKFHLIYRNFFNIYKNNNNYYSDDNVRIRSNPKYKIKKINKIKSLKLCL